MNNGQLQQVTYGNGDTVSYTYNSYGVSGVSKNGSPAYTWTYNASGLPAYHEDLLSGRQYVYQYDLTGRYVQTDVLDLDISSEYDRRLYRAQYAYDPGGNLTSRTEYPYT